MRSNSLLLAGILAGVIAVGLLGPRALAAGPIDEIEPNDTCASAQALGPLAEPLLVNGSLDGRIDPYPVPGEPPNIDFFSVAAPPETYVRVAMQGAQSGLGTLYDPFFGIFAQTDGSCDPIQLFDDTPFGLDAAGIVFTGATGVLLIGATSCCDPINGGMGGGTYQLLIEPAALIGTISGQVLDAVSGAPFPPELTPLVLLERCEAEVCSFLEYLPVDSEGRFSRSGSDDIFGLISTGDFRVTVDVFGYGLFVSSIISLGPGESHDFGAIMLEPLVAGGDISGRVVNSATGEPVSGADLNLEFCQNGICRFVGFEFSDFDGRFRFVSDEFRTLYAGDYQLRVFAFTLPFFEQTREFSHAPGVDTDLGDIGLDPLPLIGAVSGRLVDAVSGEPVRGDQEPFGYVTLLQCLEDGTECFYPVASLSTDEAGRFVLSGGGPFFIRPGTFVLSFTGYQYEPGQTEPFTVGADEQLDLGDLAMQPLPLRLLVGKRCESIPSSGGTCRYEALVANSQPFADAVQVWNTVTVFQFGQFYTSNFQPEPAQKVRLAPGETKRVRFSLAVPPTVAEGAVACVTYFVADNTRGFYFQPLNVREAFCFIKEFDGSFRMLAAEEGRTLMQRLQGVPETIRNRR